MPQRQNNKKLQTSHDNSPQKHTHICFILFNSKIHLFNP